MKVLMNMLTKIQIIDLFSELFGDLWDMFWLHHWCLRKNLDYPRFFFRKMNKSKKTQNHPTVISHYSNN